MQVKADCNWHFRSDDFAHAAQEFAFAIAMRIGDHRAMQIEIHHICVCFANTIANRASDTLERVVGDFCRWARRRPRGRNQFVFIAHLGHEARDRNVLVLKALEDFIAN
jgi:hypothetical protein